MGDVKQLNLFGDAEDIKRINAVPTKTQVFEDYDAFVEKFKAKKTTDDCYTPEHVYDAIRQWVNDMVMPLDGVNIIRPFYPGGDYEHAEYPDGCVVLDNPPFSILAKIRKFYQDRGIKYFLFAPALTMASSTRDDWTETFVMAHCEIEYANGAMVRTGFVTNMMGNLRIWIAGSLYRKIQETQKQYRRERKASKKIPKYRYPDCVISSALAGKIACRAIDVKIERTDCVPINALDAQRAAGKGLFGGGFLLSERAAAERAAAERAAAERAAAEEVIEWQLSDREKKIQQNLGR